MNKFIGKYPNNFQLPNEIARLGEFVYNLWWVWEKESLRLFTEIDAHLWEVVNHNPIKFLRDVDQDRLKEIVKDQRYLDYYNDMIGMFDDYMSGNDTWFKKNYHEQENNTIAYFSSEFGLHETLPIYAGGLGILSGDHVKAASDLGLPFVSIGFFYTQGYFTQHITEDGWQEAGQVELKFDELPVSPICEENGELMTITVEMAGREIKARMWEVRVGRNPLYLLDTDVDGNTPEDRKLTARLYSSDLDLRISQEIVLGMGGVKALRKLGYDPKAWHMNEGHSAFLTIEQIREFTESGLSFNEAVEKVKANNVFTTHTPVPAGADEFPKWLIDKYFSKICPMLGLSSEEFFGLARVERGWGEVFSMPVLAFRMSSRANGVSELHGQVARKMWNFLWPEKKEDEVPIGYITNGVHTGTWLARRIVRLFNQYLPEGWMERLDDESIWQAVDDIPDAELWDARRHSKRVLAGYLRNRARKQWMYKGVAPVQVVAAGVLMNPYALTIGFARRFATYKRAGLVLEDMDRLLSLINQPNKPVQIIFAGKSHPADKPGKTLIQEVYQKVKSSENGGRLMFLEDYDMNLGRYLTQGVDVWLNTPRRPNEASGTSGQKAAMNGVINFSILDGWWREGYNGENGWAIGQDKDYTDPDEQDRDDLSSLYDILENEIIPLYYDTRPLDNMSAAWMKYVTSSIKTLTPKYNIRRMVKEYTEDYYIPVMDEGVK